MRGWWSSGAPALGLMSRTGLGICAVAAALAAAAPLFGDLLRGPDRGGRGTRIATFDDGFVIAAVVGTAVLVGAALTPRLWAQFAGIVVATLIAFGSALQVGSPRLSKDFAADADLVLLGGGTALVVTVTAGLAGIVVTLVGIRREPPVPAAAEAPAPDAEPRVASKAVVALGLAVAGLLLGILPPLAIAFGVIALAEIRADAGRLRGQGVAVAAIAVGIVSFSLWISFIAFAMLAAVPPA